MSKKERIEYSVEEKQEFISNHMKVNFWAEKDLLLEFDKLCKSKGTTRKDALIKYMTKVVEKHGRQ